MGVHPPRWSSYERRASPQLAFFRVAADVLEAAGFFAAGFAALVLPEDFLLPPSRLSLSAAIRSTTFSPLGLAAASPLSARILRRLSFILRALSSRRAL